jgi:hypothetical protein
MALRIAELAGVGPAVAGRAASDEAGDARLDGTLWVPLGEEPEVASEVGEVGRV